MRTSVQDLRDDRYANSFLTALGLSYWFAVLLKPDLVGNLDATLSAAAMAVVGALVLGNLLLDSALLWASLGAVATAGIISSWTGVTQWAVPYSTGAAAVSMALLNAGSAVVYFAKALEE